VVELFRRGELDSLFAYPEDYSLQSIEADFSGRVCFAQSTPAPEAVKTALG
jgi:hypothetical protein